MSVCGARRPIPSAVHCRSTSWPATQKTPHECVWGAAVFGCLPSLGMSPATHKTPHECVRGAAMFGCPPSLGMSPATQKAPHRGGVRAPFFMFTSYSFLLHSIPFQQAAHQQQLKEKHVVVDSLKAGNYRIERDLGKTITDLTYDLSLVQERRDQELSGQ